MTDRLFLYIDILGFSELVETEPEKIRTLYEIVASLNVHKHHAFKSIVFSDTILVYNVDGGTLVADRRYLVMFLCEFAQDLQARLTGHGIVFRALIVGGDFEHYELNGVPCFFGPALISAYRAERDIKAIGLFIDRCLIADCDIFATAQFDERFDFVFVTQSLERFEHELGGSLPIDRVHLEDAELKYFLAPEVLYLRQVHEAMTAEACSAVRAKYERTWQLFKTRYPNTIAALVDARFDWAAVGPDVDWAFVEERYPASYAFAIDSEVHF